VPRRLPGLLLACAVAGGCPREPAPSAPAPPPKPPEPALEVVAPSPPPLPDRPDLATPLRASLDAYGAGALDQALEQVAEDVVWQVMGAPIGPIRGREALGAFWREHRRVFPDSRVVPAGIWVVGDDLVVLRGIFEGTQQEEYLGLAPTGRRARAELVYLCRFKGDRIARVESYGDVSRTLREQLRTGEPRSCCVDTPAEYPIVRTPAASSRVVEVRRELEVGGAWRTPLGTALRAAASGARLEIEESFEAEGIVFAKGLWKGVHDGALAGLKPAFRPFELHVFYVVGLREGAPPSVEVFYDGAELAEDLLTDPAELPFFESSTRSSTGSPPSSDSSK
jgi:predicted ester cyclase